LTLFQWLCLNQQLAMTEHQIAYLGRGSNLGDRLHYLRQARQRLAAVPGIKVTASSRLFETEPLGGPTEQPLYLNAVIELSTLLEPETLLSCCQEIERQLGRERSERWCARTLDIDLLLVDSLQLKTESLTLPHPRLHERMFVLRPLEDVAAEIIHPVSGRSIVQLKNQLGPGPGVTCLGTW
jgi:2-amino-4-hydroxy-6-hydroxymethyldihydropteridine diphosphokinase